MKTKDVGRYSVSSVDGAELPAIREFLLRHAETSMFLLSNLANYGPGLSDALNSGNFKCLYGGDRIRGVFCLTRRGNLLAETGGKTEYAAAIVEACRVEPFGIGAVVGEWQLADAIWQNLLESGAVSKVLHTSREPLYRCDLASLDVSPKSLSVRLLSPADFDVWEPLNDAYMHEEGLPIQGSRDQRRASFVESALSGCWWGLWDDDALVALGALNAVYETLGQIGGVYTIPGQRRRGRATSLMQALIADCIDRHKLETLILFTGHTNVAAQRLYESLGFARAGEFALLFGSADDSEAT